MTYILLRIYIYTELFSGMDEIHCLLIVQSKSVFLLGNPSHIRLWDLSYAGQLPPTPKQYKPGAISKTRLCILNIPFLPSAYLLWKNDIWSCYFWHKEECVHYQEQKWLELWMKLILFCD